MGRTESKANKHIKSKLFNFYDQFSNLRDDKEVLVQDILRNQVHLMRQREKLKMQLSLSKTSFEKDGLIMKERMLFSQMGQLEEIKKKVKKVKPVYRTNNNS